MDDAALTALLSRLGLDGALKQVAQNAALGAATRATLDASGVPLDVLAKGVAALRYAVAAGLPDSRAHRRPLLAEYVGSRRLTTQQQVTAAIDFLKKKPADAEVVATELDAACGAGITFTDADVKAKAGLGLGGPRHDRGTH